MVRLYLFAALLTPLTGFFAGVLLLRRTSDRGKLFTLAPNYLLFW